MKSNRSKRELREHILACTRKQFASAVAPSLVEIAQAAGISRTTFYRAFSSREELLRVLAFDPEPESRQRLLAQAAEMIGQHGLAALSMDALADAASVSRATVYRLFPGKAALFREVVKTYAPLERVALLLEQVGDRPPEEVMLLETHVDFEREFRGDTVHPAVMEILEELNLADRLLRLPHTKMHAFTLQAGTDAASIDFSRLKTKSFGETMQIVMKGQTFQGNRI